MKFNQPRTVKDVDERLLWMLRVLGDEFGPLGVLRTAAALWPGLVPLLAYEDLPNVEHAPKETP